MREGKSSCKQGTILFPLNGKRREMKRESFACVHSQCYFKPLTDVFLLLKWARMKLNSFFFFFLDIPVQRSLGQNWCSVFIFFGKQGSSAFLRAAAYGPVRKCLPCVSSYHCSVFKSWVDFELFEVVLQLNVLSLLNCVF